MVTLACKDYKYIVYYTFPKLVLNSSTCREVLNYLELNYDCAHNYVFTINDVTNMNEPMWRVTLKSGKYKRPELCYLAWSKQTKCYF